MIEVFAKLDRGTVYLAGESIEGQVTFTNKGLFIFMIIVGTRQNAPHFIFTLFITDIDQRPILVVKRPSTFFRRR